MNSPKLEPATDHGDYVKAFEQVHEYANKVQQAYWEQLPNWAIFGPGTSDHPGMYLARLFLTVPTLLVTDCLIRANSLEEIRRLVPDGLTRIERSVGDNANIIETWLRRIENGWRRGVAVGIGSVY